MAFRRVATFKNLQETDHFFFRTPFFFTSGSFLSVFRSMSYQKLSGNRIFVFFGFLIVYGVCFEKSEGTLMGYGQISKSVLPKKKKSVKEKSTDPRPTGRTSDPTPAWFPDFSMRVCRDGAAPFGPKTAKIMGLVS